MGHVDFEAIIFTACAQNARKHVVEFWYTGEDDWKSQVRPIPDALMEKHYLRKHGKTLITVNNKGGNLMDFKDFHWTIETQHEEITDGIQIYAPADTDYFVNPVDGISKADAPFFYKEVEGDFVLRARVSHDFVSTYDACVLLALDNEKLWAKACFEYSDFETHAVVTVMTNQKSDDSNGVNIDGNEVWLQLARKENIFAIHYSLDGHQFTMSRICSLPMQKKIKVGLVAQSPTGKGGTRKFADVSLELHTLVDIRGGNQ